MAAESLSGNDPAIAGVLRVGEANATMEAVGRRQRGSRWIFLAVLAIIDVAGAFAGAKLWPERPDFGIIAGVGIATLIYVNLARRWTVARVRSRLAQRGVALELQLSMQIQPEALFYRVGDVDQKAAWHAVTELFHSRQYWIFLVQGSAWFAPQRFFVDKEAERAFVGEALSRMSEAARARSFDAIAFSTRAGGG
jgi:hypothetical protein